MHRPRRRQTAKMRKRLSQSASLLVLFDEDVDPTVLRGFGIGRHLRIAIGSAFYRDDARFRYAAPNEHVVGHLRTSRRKPPIVIDAALISAAVGVAANDNLAGYAFKNAADLTHREYEFGARLGGAHFKHAEMCVVGQADEQPLGCCLHLYIRQLSRNLRNGTADLCFEFL